jgi:VanZ family protein
MYRDFRAWTPVVLWMGFIFLMSTDVASASHTSRIIEPLLRLLHPDITPAGLDLGHLIARKCGHLSEYAVLALLARRALAKSAAGTGWSWPAVAGAWAIATAYAVTDEFHQAFVASRTSSAGDVLIDAIGAAAGLAAWFLLQRSGRFRRLASS